MWRVRRGFFEEVTFKLKQRVGCEQEMTDKRNSICKNHEDRRNWPGWWDFQSQGENGTRGWRNWQCQMVETLEGHLRDGKPLKDCKQRSDRTSFTRPVISPSPLIFVFSASKWPTMSWRVMIPGWPSPIQSHAVPLPLIVLLHVPCQLSLHSPCNPNLSLCWSSQLHYPPSPYFQIR